jgi:hypothetical protein
MPWAPYRRCHQASLDQRGSVALTCPAVRLVGSFDGLRFETGIEQKASVRQTRYAFPTKAAAPVCEMSDFLRF